MKKIISTFCAALLPAFLFAQAGEDSVEAGSVELKTNLVVGQKLQIQEGFVQFLEVISDSRCPRQVTCIWPGEAKVLLGIRMNGKYFQKEVVISGAGAELPLAEDFLMQLPNLEPYPETSKKINPEEYCLSLEVVPRGEDQ